MQLIKDSYTVKPLGYGQYEIVCGGKVYDTNEAEIIGYMPIGGKSTVLYKDKEKGYFVLGAASCDDKKPSFTKLGSETGKLWAKGIEKYWDSKV
jgi:hypothetical protein